MEVEEAFLHEKIAAVLLTKDCGKRIVWSEAISFQNATQFLILTFGLYLHQQFHQNLAISLRKWIDHARRLLRYNFFDDSDVWAPIHPFLYNIIKFYKRWMEEAKKLVGHIVSNVPDVGRQSNLLVTSWIEQKVLLQDNVTAVFLPN